MSGRYHHWSSRQGIYAFALAHHDICVGAVDSRGSRPRRRTRCRRRCPARRANAARTLSRVERRLCAATTRRSIQPWRSTRSPLPMSWTYCNARATPSDTSIWVRGAGRPSSTRMRRSQVSLGDCAPESISAKAIRALRTPRAPRYRSANPSAEVAVTPVAAANASRCATAALRGRCRPRSNAVRVGPGEGVVHRHVRDFCRRVAIAAGSQPWRRTRDPPTN